MLHEAATEQQRKKQPHINKIHARTSLRGAWEVQTENMSHTFEFRGVGGSKESGAPNVISYYIDTSSSESEKQIQFPRPLLSLLEGQKVVVTCDPQLSLWVTNPATPPFHPRTKYESSHMER